MISDKQSLYYRLSFSSINNFTIFHKSEIIMYNHVLYFKKGVEYSVFNKKLPFIDVIASIRRWLKIWYMDTC